MTTQNEKMVADFIEEMGIPAGYSREIIDGWSNGIEPPWASKDDAPTKTVIFKTEDGKTLLAVNVTVDTYRDVPRATGNGHTWFQKDGSSFFVGFDRRGIGDSFYFSEASKFLTEVREQEARIARSKARESGFVPFPGTPFRVHAENIPGYVKALSEGRSFQLTPSGFGTGYRISTRKTRWSKALPAEASKVLGVNSPLYFETFDYD